MILELIVLYIISMFVHEFGHMFGAAIQNIKSRIEYRPFGIIPSFVVYPLTTLKNKNTFYFMGGFLVFLLFGLLALLPNTIGMRWALGTLAIMHVLYAIYEAGLIEKISHTSYMIGHYLLYGIVMAVGIGLYYNGVI